MFDGDEFDVNSRDRLDMGRVHKGKHSLSKAGKNANALLEDKRDLQGLKDRFAKLVWSYRVIQQVAESFPGWWAAAVATYYRVTHPLDFYIDCVALNLGVYLSGLALMQLDTAHAD